MVGRPQDKGRIPGPRAPRTPECRASEKTSQGLVLSSSWVMQDVFGIFGVWWGRLGSVVGGMHIRDGEILRYPNLFDPFNSLLNRTSSSRSLRIHTKINSGGATRRTFFIRVCSHEQLPYVASLGAVLYFITERTPPFMFEIGQELLLADNIRHAYYETRSAPSWARELIKSLLQPRAQLRRTATDVLVVLSKVVVSPFATSHLLHDGSSSKVCCVAPSRSSSQEHPLSCMQQEFRDSGFEGFKVWG